MDRPDLNSGKRYGGFKRKSERKMSKNKFHCVIFVHCSQELANKLHILTMVPYTHSDTIIGYGENVTFSKKDTRMQEIVKCLQNTLNHEYVGTLYIFYQDIKLIPYLENQNFTSSHKLKFIPNMEDTMTSLFRYANEHLQAHIVMVMNADVYPGEGFEQLDFEYLRRNKVMYGLSR